MDKETSGQSELFPEHATKYSNRTGGHQKFQRSKDWLYRKYWTEGLSLTEVSKLLGWHPETVRRKFIELGIPRKCPSLAVSEARKKGFEKRRLNVPYGDKELLQRLYLDEELDSVEIGKRFGVKSSTIMAWLRRFAIPLFPFGYHRRGKKILSDKQREGLSIRAKEIWTRPGYRENQVKLRLGTMAGEKNINFGSKYSSLRSVREKISRANKGRKIGREEMGRRLASWNTRPSRLEHLLDEITSVTVRYVGDGKWWRLLEDGHYHNPDFKVTGQNKVIEVFGAYWHRKTDGRALIELYRKSGLKLFDNS